jgi:acetylornithine deacetylase
MDGAGVCEYIETNREALFDLVAELVEIPSVSGTERAAQERVIEELESLGLEPDVWEPNVEELRDHPAYFDTKTYDEVGYDGRPNVAATVTGSGNGRSLVLSGHVDVVDVDEDEWTHEPWAATVEDGRMYGRGACDMKGGLAAILFVYRALRDCGVELSGDLTLQSTIDEEAGGTGGVLSALERGYRPDAAIVAEPYGVPDVGIASAGVSYFRVTVPGKSAHAAYGFDGVNAINKAAAVVDALDRLDRERKARIDFAPAVNQNERADGWVTNLNVGIIEAGDWPSTVPPEATFEWFGWEAEPHECPRDADIVSTVVDRAERVCGTSGEFVGGLAGLDERFYNRYYDIPCPTVGPSGGNTTARTSISTSTPSSTPPRPSRCRRWPTAASTGSPEAAPTVVPDDSGEFREREQDSGRGDENEADDNQRSGDHEQSHVGEQPEPEAREDGDEADEAEEPRHDALEPRVSDDVDDLQNFVHGVAPFSVEELKRGCRPTSETKRLVRVTTGRGNRGNRSRVERSTHGRQIAVYSHD